MNVLVLSSGNLTIRFQFISTDLEAIKHNADKCLASGTVKELRQDLFRDVLMREYRLAPDLLPLADEQVSSSRSGCGCRRIRSAGRPVRDGNPRAVAICMAYGGMAPYTTRNLITG